jgi:lipoprotein-anchoring transpeptidase ErfK/SrfK
MQGSAGSRRIQLVGVVAATLTLLVVAGCSSRPHGGSTPQPSGAPSAAPAVAAASVALAVTPASGATGVLTSTDVKAITDGVVSAVTVTGAGDAPVPGSILADHKTWRPATQLAYATHYTASVTATKDGLSKTVKSAFTTMPAPSNINGASLYVGEGSVVGIAMPIVVEFTSRVDPRQRAAIERRMTVTSTPPVVGSWHWWSSDEVHFRPKAYWTPGTKVTVHVAIGGMPMGYGKFGKRDRLVHFSIGSSVVTKVDGQTHTAKVFKNGVLIRTMPASLGKPSTPTSAGTLVVMDKKPAMTFDSGTFGVPSTAPGGYKSRVFWDVRFTWGGEFFHSAPWSVHQQGYVNVSHGCVNLSPANAKWFFDLAKKGDAVEITRSGRNVKPGDGWTDWSVPWASYVKGSALYGASQQYPTNAKGRRSAALRRVG